MRLEDNVRSNLSSPPWRLGQSQGSRHMLVAVILPVWRRLGRGQDSYYCTTGWHRQRALGGVRVRIWIRRNMSSIWWAGGRDVDG